MISRQFCAFAKAVTARTVAGIFMILTAAVPAPAQPLTLRNFAGVQTGGPDGPALDAQFRMDGANTLTRDAAGNFYFVDTYGSSIRKMTPDGEVSTVAGISGYSGHADGGGAEARFSRPMGLAFDDQGNLFVADTSNHVIRKITPMGMVITIAGMPGVSGNVNGVGSAARFNEPRGIVVDREGVIYVTDYNNGSIRKITSDGTVSNFAVLVWGAMGMDVDSANNLYVVTQMQVKKYTPSGALTNIAGGTVRGYVDGTGASARFDVINDIAVDPSGSVMFVTDFWNARVRKVTAAGVVTTIAGSGFGGPQLDGTGSSAKFRLGISGIVFDTAESVLYVADEFNIRKVTTGGAVTTPYGSFRFGFADGPRQTAKFYEAQGSVGDSAGNVYVNDLRNHRIRKIAPDGVVSTFAGSATYGSTDGVGAAATFLSPRGMTIDASGNLYITDSNAIRKITPYAVVTTLAGDVFAGGALDGIGTAARFSGPYDLAWSAGCSCLYVADTYNYTIRKVAMDGTVTTLAGRAGVQGTTNGTGSGALFKSIGHIAADSVGNAFVTEWFTYSVRKITSTGVVTTYAGSSWSEAEVDGPADVARFKSPRGLATDAAGNVYVAANWGPSIRKISTAGLVSTIVGISNVYRDWSEGTGQAASLSAPEWLGSDPFGNFFVSDTSGWFVMKLTPALADAGTVNPAIGLVGVTRQLKVQPQTATSYHWEWARKPSRTNAALSATNIANPVFTPDVADTYTFKVTAQGQNGSSVTYVDVVASCDSTPPSISVVGGNDPSCAGAPVTLDGGSWSSYSWSNGATTRMITVSPSENTTYTLTVIDGDGCVREQAIKTITITPPAGPVTISGGGATAICAEGTGGTFTAASSVGVSYQWGFRTETGGPISILPGRTNSAYTLTASDFAPGTYLLVAIASASCGTPQISPEIAVTIYPTAAVPTITPPGPTTFCAGGTVTLTASSGAAYLWSNGATTQSMTAAASGDYTVTVTNANGCSATSEPVTVTTYPEVAGWLSVNNTACIGSESPASAQAIVGGAYVDATYAWSITGGTITQNSGKNIMFRAESDPLLLTVVITDVNGCSVTKSKSVFVTSQPEPVITTSGPTTFCEGGYVTLTANEGSSFGGYLWSTGATTQSILVTESGTYSVTASGNDCSATSRNVVVTVLPAPAVTITASGPTAFCEGGSVTLTASGASSYLWSNGATTPSITVTAAGENSVVGTNANGCSNNMGMIVTTYPAPAATITASGPTTFCEGGSVTLTAPSGYSYAWSTGATTQSINATTSGSYSVTVTNASGCSTTSSPTTVTVNAAPAATISASGPTTFCVGGSVTMTASAASSYLWSNGATTPSIVVTTAGSYSVTVTSAAGCSATSAPTSVVVNANPATPAITASGPTSFCAGGSVTLTAPAGFTYLWSTGATSQSIVASAAGSYSVTVTNASGCSTSSAATSVTVDAATTITQQPQSKTIPKNIATQLSVTAIGTGTLTYQWYRGTSPSTATSISGATTSTYTTPKLTRGTYTYWVRVTGTCGVANSATATITAQ